jgi:hypothetical protein
MQSEGQAQGHRYVRSEMKKIARFDRTDLDTIKDAAWLVDTGVYDDYDDFCFFATAREYDNSIRILPSELHKMIYETPQQLPAWATHVLWVHK